LENLEIFDYIKDKIFTGVWAPGTKLPSENKLCEMFGISRIKVRENVQKLVALNMVMKKRGSGAYVEVWQPSNSIQSEFSPYVALNNFDYKEIFEYRKGLETIAIELFIKNAGREHLDELKIAHLKMVENQDQPNISTVYDAKFHSILVAGSGNRLIIKMNEIISPLVVSHIRSVNKIIAATERAISEHSAIIEAVENRDIEKGITAIKNHMDRNIKELAQLNLREQKKS
jgi:GntR family transcriptional regulator, transcriptional repressor for pyruvate dehydrogenase complex